jgi:hypothetical protein
MGGTSANLKQETKDASDELNDMLKELDSKLKFRTD